MTYGGNSRLLHSISTQTSQKIHNFQVDYISEREYHLIKIHELKIMIQGELYRNRMECEFSVNNRGTYSV